MTARAPDSASGRHSSKAWLNPWRAHRGVWIAVLAVVAMVVATTVVMVFKSDDFRRAQSVLAPPGCVRAARCEAEYAELSGTRPETPGPGQWAGYSGSNFVVGFEHPGTSITWKVVNAPAGPGHVADIRYSNYSGQDGKVEPRQLTLLVNERPKQIVFPTTQSWPAWADLKVSDIELADGENVIRLACTSSDSGRVNIDFITIY